jgi:hypothetical protein
MQRKAIEHRFDVRRHVVRPLHLVNPAGVRRGNALERGHEVGAHIGIGILLNDERSRRVPQIEEQRAVACIDLRQEAGNVARDLEEALAGSLDR